MSVVINGTNYINVYGHSGSQRKREREELFSEKIILHLNKTSAPNVMIGGDFNCWLDSSDSKGKANTFSPELNSLITNMRLKDLEYVLKGSAKSYSFLRGNSASRLDRFYINSELVAKIHSFQTVDLAFSDHCAKMYKINVDRNDLGQTNGKGMWKINSSFLNNDEIENEYCFFYENLKKVRSYTENFPFWWCCYLKSKTKNFYKSKSINFNQELNRRKSFLYQALAELSQSQDNRETNNDELQFVKSKLLEIETEKLQHYESKLTGSNLVEGERLSLFQLISQQKRQRNSLIELKKESGEVTSSVREIRNMIFDHYSNTFKRKNLDPNDATLLENVTKALSNEQKIKLCEPITDDELFTVINNSAKKKSPGPDGLTYEFYKKHFDLLKDDLLKLFNDFLIGGVRPPSEFLIPKLGTFKT